jgi:integrase
MFGLADSSSTCPTPYFVIARSARDSHCTRSSAIALTAAARDGLLADNPAKKVPRPWVSRVEARFLSDGEVAAVLTAAASPHCHARHYARYHAVLCPVAATGLRKSEALALKWTDVDMNAATLAVRGTLSRQREAPRHRTEDRQQPPSASALPRCGGDARGAQEGPDGRRLRPGNR